MIQWWYTWTEQQKLINFFEKDFFTQKKSQDISRSLNNRNILSNAITVKKSLITKLINATSSKFAEDVLKRVIVTMNTLRPFWNVSYVKTHISSLARTAENSICLNMNRTFCMIQLNMRKQSAVHNSLMNDEETQNATVVTIQKPQTQRIQSWLLMTLMNHDKWTKMIFSTWRKSRWAIWSMLWINKNVKAEQISIKFSDITVAIVWLSNWTVLIVSVYVSKCDPQALQDTCNNLCRVITEVRRTADTVMKVAVAEDFNWHNQLWEDDDIFSKRQSEADLIIDLMNEFALSSLLSQNMKTWHNEDYKTTINLVLASEELKDATVKCAIYKIEHKSDHCMIKTVFDVSISVSRQQEQLLLWNTSWKKIKIKIADMLSIILIKNTVQQMTDKLMSAVLETVHTLTSKARLSLYAKQWWTSDITQLHCVYTY